MSSSTQGFGIDPSIATITRSLQELPSTERDNSVRLALLTLEKVKLNLEESYKKQWVAFRKGCDQLEQLTVEGRIITELADVRPIDSALEHLEKVQNIFRRVKQEGKEIKAQLKQVEQSLEAGKQLLKSQASACSSAEHSAAAQEE